MKERLCAYDHCKKPLVLKPGERPSKLLRRSYCNPECSRKHNWQRAAGNWATTRKCENCGIPYGRRSNEASSTYRKRRFCSQGCRCSYVNKMRHRKPEPLPKTQGVFSTVDEWLAHNKPTICPTVRLVPEPSMSRGLMGRMDGRVGSAGH